MSNISSNSLFHFTSRAEHLISILTDNFIPRYCYEKVELEIDGRAVSAAIPMVCFCDISLGQIKDHIEVYGSYGIGMTKEWGIRSKLNPIVYINANSILASSISRLAGYLIDDKTIDSNILEEHAITIKFLKPYVGDFLRDGKTISSVKFYNEREWRFIPDIQISTENIQHTLSLQDFNNPIFRAEANRKLKDYSLPFDPADIKYIFVKDESEIHPMIQALRNIKQKYDPQTIEILTTKILTTDQLREDF